MAKPLVSYELRAIGEPLLPPEGSWSARWPDCIAFGASSSATSGWPISAGPL